MRHVWRMFRLCSLLLFLANPCFGDVLSGSIRVVDADTIDIGAGANIRLSAIDAPEGAQSCRDGARVLACGQMATEAARRLYAGRWADCEVAGRDRYDRFLAVCRVDGIDMNRELVRLGIARTYRDDPLYGEAQKEAILFARGLWSYEMEDPATFRAAARGARMEACAIKGNISGNGRIYHLPGQAHYDRTRVNEGRGERWFCSEAEAERAGWRRARR